jgi:hypothetical protein
MGWFGRRSASEQKKPAEPAVDAVGDRFGPLAIVQALDLALPKYLASVDRGDLVYPAGKRTPTDMHGTVRSIWEHTRLEAMRYVMMVPRRDVELLIEPDRQAEMIDAFLRRPPHDDTVVDFTGVPIDDFVIAIVAGLNWLSHCAVLAGVVRGKFSGTLHNFRKIAVGARQWWAMDGADARCAQMLREHEKPPLMLYLIWLEYTRLAKEIAIAAIYGPSLDQATARNRAQLTQSLAARPAELAAALDALSATTARLESARDPDDLLG